VKKEKGRVMLTTGRGAELDLLSLFERTRSLDGRKLGLCQRKKEEKKECASGRRKRVSPIDADE